MTKDDKYLWRLCKNIIAGRFNWRRYCSRQSYYGREICVTPLFCSYGQIGYTVNFLIQECQMWNMTGNLTN